MIDGKKNLLTPGQYYLLSAANGLAATARKGKVKPTMRDLLKEFKVIKKNNRSGIFGTG